LVQYFSAFFPGADTSVYLQDGNLYSVFEGSVEDVDFSELDDGKNDLNFRMLPKNS
jgi:hypothetical protein